MYGDTEIFHAGGGFSMGSTFFYLEFLLVWLALLKEAGFSNPAIFGLEYKLVPDACYPKQLRETVAGYNHLLSKVDDPSAICVAGDSAGATLVLSLLLHLGHASGMNGRKRPGMAVLISPWVTLVSPEHRDTPSDYLNTDSLHLYARQYVGAKVPVDDPMASPGNCIDAEWWKRSSPSQGFSFFFGSEEVFAPTVRDLVALLRKSEIEVESREEKGGIHAWPVASIFLKAEKQDRQDGLLNVVRSMRRRLGGKCPGI